MKYFTIKECTQSSTARARRIDNTPNSEHLAHIRESIETLVDPLREAWAEHCRMAKLGTAGIRISSGYRGPKLNAAVGGSRIHQRQDVRYHPYAENKADCTQPHQRRSLQAAWRAA